MKKIFTLFVMSFFALSTFAELAYNTTLTQNDFNNASTVVEKADGQIIEWDADDAAVRCGGTDRGAFSGPAWNWDDKYFVVKLANGVPNKLTFQYVGYFATTQTNVSVKESANGSDWSDLWNTTSNASNWTEVSQTLHADTRYLRFCFHGNFSASFKDIKVTEKILLGTPNPDTLDFGTVKVDDVVEAQAFSIGWTNLTATVTSSDAHFTVSPAEFGAIGLATQKDTILVGFNTNAAGSFSGTITIEGRGKSAIVAVSGVVEKYNQTITWNPTQSYNWNDAIAPATASSNLAVSYEISDPTVLKFENGAFVKLHAGSVTVTAKQAGNYKYNAAANVAKTFTIVGPATSAQETMTIAYGAQETWHGYDLSTYAVGTHTLTYTTTNAQGGVHTITLTLTVTKQNTVVLTQNLEFCEGDSAEYRGVWYKEAGTHQLNIAGATCDTTITVVVTVNETIDIETEIAEMAGETISFDEDGWLVRGETAVVARAYTTSKADTADLWFIRYSQTAKGCDDIHKLIVEVEILDPVELEKEIEVCEGDSAEYRGVYYSEAGEYPVLFEGAARDTMVNVIVIVNEPSYNQEYETVLAGDIINLPDGEWFINETPVTGEYQTLRSDTAGLVFVQYGQTEKGCEAITALYVTVTPNYEAIDNISVDAKAEKFFRNGVLYIRRGEQIFTAAGDRVE